MTQTHTPGPWEVELGDSTTASEVWSVKPFCLVCDVHSHLLSINHADALLIAAAPELLAALEANHQWHQDHDDHGGYPGSELEKLNIAAITKAQGGAS